VVATRGSWANKGRGNFAQAGSGNLRRRRSSGCQEKRERYNDHREQDRSSPAANFLKRVALLAGVRAREGAVNRRSLVGRLRRVMTAFFRFAGNR
jgi:hypothetical protein